MGLREKARKSLEANEDEIDAPVLLKVDAAEREEAKARVTQLRKELEDARKLSDAKTAQIARQDDTIHGLQTRVKDLEAASAIAERDAKKAVKELEGEIKEAREELQDLQEQGRHRGRRSRDGKGREETHGARDQRGVPAQPGGRGRAPRRIP